MTLIRGKDIQGVMMGKNKNVLLLMVDQQRWDTIHALGNKVIRTPNLDRLCRRGTAFVQAYSTVPVCAAARDALLTGASSRVRGAACSSLRWRPNARPIQNVLGEAGYKTGAFGKMHFSVAGDGYGFKKLKVHEEVNSEKFGFFRDDDDYNMYLVDKGMGHLRYVSGVRNVLYNQPQISIIAEEHHETRWVADQALDFINAYHSAPFFCKASWMQPHWPVNVPKEWANLYAVEDITEPVWSEVEQAHLPWFTDICRNASDMADRDKPIAMTRIKRAKALYYASISYIDYHIGRILERLEALGQLENTLIFFTSDHGELLFDHLSIAKCVAYDAAIRVPFIVAGPGMGQGEVCEDFVSHADFAPTVYDYTGITPGANIELVGASLLGDRPIVRQRDSVFSELNEGVNGGFVTIRTKKWKYAFYHQGGLRQLFDLEADAEELDNLLLRPTEAHAAVAADLHQRLLVWSSAHSVPSRIKSGDFVVVPRPPVFTDRNNQDDGFAPQLPEAEKAKLWSEARCVYEAIKDEPYLDPADLDLNFWEAKRGPGCIAELEQLLGRRLRS